MSGEAERADVEEIIRRFEPRDMARVSPADVVTAEWVRIKCQYGCGGYGQCLTCPPHSPTPEQTRKLLDEYQVAYLLWWGDKVPGRQQMAEIERQTFLAGYYKAWLLASGPCDLCSPCPLERPCRHPYQARPSPEACGIDVFATARRAGFPIQVVPTHDDIPNFYSLLLVE